MRGFIVSVFFLFLQFIVNAQQTGPKNIIVMIGDGMGFEQINTALFYNGNSEENVWLSFPVKLAASTGSYGIDYDYTYTWTVREYVTRAFTESSAASTAMSTSVRTRAGMIGMSPDSIPLLNPVELSYLIGKSGGIVTTVPFCHATPAGFSAHNISRYEYGEIAFDMIVHSPLALIMGAGHPLYDNDGRKKDTANYKYVFNRNLWNSVLLGSPEVSTGNVVYSMKDIDYDGKPDEWFFSDDLSFLKQQIAEGTLVKRVFYLAPVNETLQYERSDSSVSPWAVPDNNNIPSLSQMSVFALDFLSSDSAGFFLMIEGGAIDWACHDNDLSRLIEEQTDFEYAVNDVVHWISEKNIWDETLLIILADHETGYLCSGFDPENGFSPVFDKGKGMLPDAVFLSDNHTNHLVPFFARGNGSHVFQLLATSFDPVRGPYIHIAHVASVIRYFWGNAAYAFPASSVVCEGEQLTLTAVAPYNACSFQWMMEGEMLTGENSPFLTISPLDDSDFFCILTCAGTSYMTNTIHVTVDKCNE